MSPENEIHNDFKKWSKALNIARAKLVGATDVRDVVSAIEFSKRLASAANLLEEWEVCDITDEICYGSFAKAARMMLSGEKKIEIDYTPNELGPIFQVNFRDVYGEDFSFEADGHKFQPMLRLEDWRDIVKDEQLEIDETERKYSVVKVEAFNSFGSLALVRDVNSGIFIEGFGMISTEKVGFTKGVLGIDDEQHVLDYGDWYYIEDTSVILKIYPNYGAYNTRLKIHIDCPRDMIINREELLYCDIDSK